MIAAESVAEKLGLPCHVFVQGDAEGPTVELRRTETAVEAHVSGLPESAMAAATRPVTTVFVERARNAESASLAGEEGPKIVAIP